MPDELKRCPFCGGEANSFPGVGPDSFAVMVICTICNATTGGPTRDIAVAAWNRRIAAAEGRAEMTVRDLLATGWTVDRTSLYDEEGVEGWRWTSPENEEFTVIGDWNEPPPPPEHRERCDGR